MLTNECVFISASIVFIYGAFTVFIVKKRTPGTVRKLIEAIKERYKLKIQKFMNVMKD